MPSASAPTTTERQRDKRVTREIHRLFWQANLVQKRNLIITYVCRIIGFIIINTLFPLISAFAIQAILQKDIGRVEQLVSYIIIGAVAYGILTYFGETAISKNAIAGSKYIQNKIFENYLSKDYDFYSNTYFGALGSKANNLRDAYNQYGFLVTLIFPRQIIVLVTNLAIIAWQSWLLALITFIAVAVVLGYTLAISAYRVRFRRDTSFASSQVAGKLGDALTHATTVKSFATETVELQQFQPTLNNWSKAQYKQWISVLPSDIGRMSLAATAIAVLLLVSAHLYIGGSVTTPIIILVQLYAVRLVATTIDLAEMIKSYEQVMSISYEPVRTMLIPTTIKDPVEPRPLKISSHHELTLSRITYKYPEAGTKQYAIKDVSLQITAGEKIGIVGYSGSGKTTLTKLLLRFMDVTDGSIMIDGVDLREFRQADIRQAISYVPQEPLLFHRTIGENIAYGKPAASDDDVKRAAKQAYVNEFVKDLPKGYDTFVGERGVKLSGGQRQLVAIARAILKDAPILVLDEATAALDSESEAYIQEALWKLMIGRTAVVIAHRLSTLKRMDRIVVMDKGSVVQNGSHQQLLQQNDGIYAKLWQHQSGGYIAADR